MELFEAIHNRQSVGKVKEDAVPREMIEKLLSAAVQAPNHYKVRPWRFVVLTGEGRNKLGEVMAASQRDQHPDFPQAAFDKTRGLPLRAPVLIAVGADKPSEEKVLEIENVSAVSAACQNWRTGEWARDPKVKEFLGFSADQHIVSFLYIGYPEAELSPKERPSFEDRTVWMEN